MRKYSKVRSSGYALQVVKVVIRVLQHKIDFIDLEYFHVLKEVGFGMVLFIENGLSGDIKVNLNSIFMKEKGNAYGAVWFTSLRIGM
jgi:hypothetical protein